MSRHRNIEIKCAALLSAALLAACGGKQTTASKSAAAYREAQASGIHVGDEGHEQSAPSATPTPPATTDHATHGMTTDAHGTLHHSTASPQRAMDHTDHATDHGGHGATRRRDHAAMGHPETAHGVHRRGEASIGDHARHGTANARHEAHAALQHDKSHASDLHSRHQQQPAAAHADPHARHRQPSTPTQIDPHAGHAMSGPAPSTIAAGAPRSSSEMRSLQPASTLRQDAFDAAAPMSVSEATKGTLHADHEGH